MKAAFMVLMFFGLNIVVVKSESFYVATAPNVIRFDHDEEMVISVFEDRNVLFEIWLEHKGKRFSKETVVVLDERSPATVTFKVTENDIIKAGQEKPRTLTLVVNNTKHGTSKRDVVLSYRTGYLILQTDKPIYTPMQSVNVRALALDENLKVSPITWNVGMDIVSPSNQTMGRFLPKYSQSGFYRNYFSLPPYPEIGIWTVRAFYRGQLETETRTRFEVKEYVLPTFRVTIDVSEPFLLIDSVDINVTVTAEYVYGKRVDGNAGLNLYLINPVIGAEEYITETKRKPLTNGVGYFNIKRKDIPNNKTNLIREGSRLKVVATVTEEVTGKEEATYHDGTVFAAFPLKFDFTRTKKTYLPGREYTLKVDITYPNGKPASRIIVTLIMMKGNTENVADQIYIQTNRNGQAIASFSTERNGTTLRFKVDAPLEHKGIRYTSPVYTVAPYIGENQIQVDYVVREDKSMWMKASANMIGNRYTGMMFMVISRGKTVFKNVVPGANSTSEQISEELQEMASPGGRLLVYYIDKQNRQLVADSEKFNVEAKCRGYAIKIQPSANTVEPGRVLSLKITGHPDTWVGTSAIDKAHLSLNSNYVLTMDEVYEALESHDLGCGMGGGKNVEDVFKNTGLTIMTNAVLTSNLLSRNSEGCLSNSRRKRNADVKTGMFSKSLVDDDSWEEDLKRLKDEGVRLRTRSDFRESLIFEERQLNKQGELAQMNIYPESITTWMIQAIGITPGKGMCVAEPVEVQAFRDFFIQLDLPYRAVRMEQFDVKATIFNYGTEVKTANVYLEGQHSLCYNSDPGSSSTRVQLHLAAKSAETVRFPIIPLEAGKFPINVTAIVINTNIPVVDSLVKNLWVVNEGLEQVMSIQVCLDPNKQMEDCENTPKRVANSVLEDAVEILQIDLTLPADSIPGTGSAAAYVQSNIMNVNTFLNGVDQLLIESDGTREENMFCLASTVYAMMYLKQTKQITEEIEEHGNRFIRSGINREIMQYRQLDGSYYIGQHRASSIWLTAFVAKVFCQAKSIIGDVVRNEDIRPTIFWLYRNRQADGTFVDSMPVLFRQMTGQVAHNDPSLTAFVLISLQECIGVEVNGSATTRYLESLPEPMLRSNPHLLAISTYALAMSKSEKTMTFINMLGSIKKTDGQMIYWDGPGGTPAESIETTAYALLAYLQYHDFKTSASIVRWLTAQRHSSGFFRTLQGTVVGLQALSIYNDTLDDIRLFVTFLSKHRGPIVLTTKEDSFVQIVRDLPVKRDDNQLRVAIQGRGSARLSIDLHYNRKYKPNEVCYFHLSDVVVGEVVEGIDEILAKERNCDVCGQCDDTEGDPVIFPFKDELIEAQPRIQSYFGRKKRETVRRGTRATLTKQCIQFDVRPTTLGNGSNMSVVNFGLETGMKVVEEDLQNLMKTSPNIARYELPKHGKGFIIFYLDQTNSRKTDFIFRLIDSGDVIGRRQPASVTVYDYYNPNKKCSKFYGTGANIDNIVEAQCDRNEKNCQCMQSVCAQSVDDEIIYWINAKKRPELILKEYACNPVKANYVVIAKVTSVEYNLDTDQKTANAVVKTDILRGQTKFQEDDEIYFAWKAHCQFPNLQSNKTYLFIGKDGKKIEKADGTYEYQYPLMGTSKVIEQNHKEYKINNVVNQFKRIMNIGTCVD